MAAVFKELFGENLLTKAGLKPVEEVLADKKAVGLFFGADRTYTLADTQKLAGMYNFFFEVNGMEIVLVVKDCEEIDQASFDSYYGEQPWVALPYDQTDIKANLVKKYEIVGISVLVILDPSGGVLLNKWYGMDAVLNPSKYAKLFVDSIGADLTPDSEAALKSVAQECYEKAGMAKTGKEIKCLRAFYAEGAEQGTTGMWFNTGRTLSKDFPSGTSLQEMRDHFGPRQDADFKDEASIVYEDGSMEPKEWVKYFRAWYGEVVCGARQYTSKNFPSGTSLQEMRDHFKPKEGHEVDFRDVVEKVNEDGSTERPHRSFFFGPSAFD